MQIVQENADARHLAKFRKHDAVLSCKLFQHINSASFSRVVEIQSLRHALAMLGHLWAIYGPFLALVQACEKQHACASDFTDSLFLAAAQVNQAHVSGLSRA